MSHLLIAELRRHLSESTSATRKAWADQIVDDAVPLQDLLELLLIGDRTSQRFMWLIGDICERDPLVVEDCMPVLFSLRAEMPFPGMPRSVAKWLLLTGVPEAVEAEAIEQLLDWVMDDDTSIGCKSYAAKAILQLVKDQRVSHHRATRAIESQAANANPAFSHRMRKLVQKLADLSDSV